MLASTYVLQFCNLKTNWGIKILLEVPRSFLSKIIKNWGMFLFHLLEYSRIRVQGLCVFV